MSKTIQEIIDTYISFFKNKNHTPVASSSLIPKGDPSLLFTTAGMVQFKPYFAGTVELPFTRATSVQKCIRTTDLENVGKTERHCTFFEMLGNFSFGDYFKKEAIEYAWDLAINHLGFAKEKIWTTVYLDDEESVGYWKELGVAAEQIVRLGKEDNFWGPAGDSGACGPSSELYIDRGIDKGCKRPQCQPGCNCDRFMEFWNLVFNQFNQDTTGKMHPLDPTGIDTGAGVERIAVLLQGVDSVYDTDELKRIIKFTEKISGVQYDNSNAASFRVIADHSRAVLFALSDSIMPDRTGRGYVVRRLIRRAVLYSRKIGIKNSFLYKLVDELVAIYKLRYPELEENADTIKTVIEAEEDLFLNTLETGLVYLEEILEKYKQGKQTVFSGKDSFLLYGTYGFPPEMTAEIAAERGIEFDWELFHEELEKDREQSRETWKGKKASFVTGLGDLATEFCGYENTQMQANVLYVLAGNGEKRNLSTGEEGVLILDKTPFYPEGGGQIGDTGFISSDAFVFEVIDTQKENDTILHFGKVNQGTVQPGAVTAAIQSERRSLLQSHHSATHLLNGALRDTLGSHVSQKASLVSPDYLRFDFSHAKAMSSDEIETVEEKVNIAIAAQIPVQTRILPLAEAKKTGAVAAFDEKYGDSVRVVSMQDASVEFCGGTHVKNTGDIKYFHITKESSPGAGNRRIEAVCSQAATDYFSAEFTRLGIKIDEFNSRVKGDLLLSDEVPDASIVTEGFSRNGTESVKIYRKKLQELEASLAQRQKLFLKEQKKAEQQKMKGNSVLADDLFQKAETVKDIKVIRYITQQESPQELKDLGDKLKTRDKYVVCLFAARSEKNATLVFMASANIQEKNIHCGNLLKESVALLGGKGGGRPDFAQGGGSDIANLEEAIGKSYSIIQGV